MKINRDNNGKFARRRSKRFLNLCFILVLIAVVFALGDRFHPFSVSVEEIAEVIDYRNTLEDKIVELKAELMNDLIKCESVGATSSDKMSIGNLVTYDPDPRQPKKQVASFGLLKFKSKTVIDYYKTFYQVELTAKESVMLALNDKKIIELAEKIIYEDEGKGVGNWYNCAKKNDLVKRVDFIKELES